MRSTGDRRNLSINALAIRAMTDSELQRLQEALGMVLPAAYVEIMREFPAELQHWPAWADSERRTFYSDVDVILDANKKIRENPGQFVKFPKEFRAAWPKNLFLFGDYDSESFYLIDANKPQPEVDGGLKSETQLRLDKMGY